MAAGRAACRKKTDTVFLGYYLINSHRQDVRSINNNAENSHRPGTSRLRISALKHKNDLQTD